MGIKLEQILPPLESEGLNSAKDGTLSGDIAFTGAVTLTAPTVVKATGTATGGAATVNGSAVVIETAGLTTAAGATYVLNLTNSSIGITNVVLASVNNSTNSAGMPAVTTVSAGAGGSYITIQNIHSADAFNGTLKIAVLVV